jgi:Mlc titration factor MtfA (ptsG expression regulator)
MGVLAVGWSIMVIAFFISQYKVERERKHREYCRMCSPPQVDEKDLVFEGRTLAISPEEQHAILMRRFPYYKGLEFSLQQRFLKRLNIFINSKIFIIKEEEGFKEMPLLVSAAAIQLSFGLDDFILPFYRYVRIYHQEYFALHNFSFLAGNVQGRTITVAWNHFLDGVENTQDGSNVGLHEMSHALYFQKLIIDENYAKRFTRQWKALIAHCEEAHKAEVSMKKDLYSDYAAKEMQEFWAESVELFFEKPVQLKQEYPEVFGAMCNLLNQDPTVTNCPLLNVHTPFREGLIQLTTQLRDRSLNRSAVAES